MMPGTIAVGRTKEVKSPVVAAFDFADLTYAERVVALYASDMPAGRRSRTKDEVRAWIVQGTGRLSRAELRRRAAFWSGHKRLKTSGVVSEDVQARHEQRFPDAGRLRAIGHAVATSVLFDGTSASALKRNTAAQVDGECACGGGGRIEFIDPETPNLGYEMDCPVHFRPSIGGSYRDYR